jgi:hypothetical protein
MKNITDKVDLEAYLVEDEGEKYVLLRIFKNGIVDGVGLKLPGDMSKIFTNAMKEEGLDLD